MNMYRFTPAAYGGMGRVALSMLGGLLMLLSLLLPSVASATATRVAGPIVVRDWSYVSEEVVGEGYILAGDAACFVDPLFSSGVHLALSAGVLAAACVTSALRDPTLRGPAGQVYKELYYRQYGHFRELAKLFYASNRSVESYFWEARRILGADESLSPRQAYVKHKLEGGLIPIKTADIPNPWDALGLSEDAYHDELAGLPIGQPYLRNREELLTQTSPQEEPEPEPEPEEERMLVLLMEQPELTVSAVYKALGVSVWLSSTSGWAACAS